MFRLPWLLRAPVLLLCTVFCLSGCAVNPVTGKNELVFVPEASEISMGAQQYGPGRQMQGGDYTAHPEIVAYVRSVGQRLAAVSDRQLPYEFNVINDDTPNAWALPGGKIAINRGLLTELSSEAELAAVLGHEIVHSAARHGAKNMERGMLLQGAVLATTVATSNSEYAALAAGGAGVASQLITQKYSRGAELEADYYGMLYMSRAGYDPQAAIELQRTFVRLSEGQQSNWLDGMFSSHPPSMERVDANRDTAAQLGPGGELGTQRYASTMEPLRRDQPAYEKYAQGRKALKKGELGTALQYAESALALQPKEPLFHSLRGDIHLQQKKYVDAISNFDRALALDPTFFHYYLQRGLAHQQLNHTQQAQADLQRSIDFLPTAPALNGMGKLALSQGNTPKAKEFFAGAAASQTPVGVAAKNALVRLDIGDNPQKYLHLGAGLDARGYLILQLANDTAEPVTAIEIQVIYVDRNKNRHSNTLQINQVVQGSQQVRFGTDIGPLSGLEQVQARITHAAIAKR
ncbi:MAG: M48 family metalloprotease [Desulfuromonadaceae bacterium]|nr:M48 family metalloprotease [Desulfuromonas sp.]MDY0185059.1 M48 family metalloprotease [Desulfuromonadaceae bacterium]